VDFGARNGCITFPLSVSYPVVALTGEVNVAKHAPWGRSLFPGSRRIPLDALIGEVKVAILRATSGLDEQVLLPNCS
jgi:hypothetical protein